MTPKLTTTIFFNYCFDKRRFQSFLHWFFKKNYYGQSQLLGFLEKLKFLGFHSATQAGFSISIEDLKIPYSKSAVVSTAENTVLDAEFQMLAGNLTQIERYQRIIEIWNRTSENLKYQVLQSFQFSNLFNPVYLMAFSGARGNIAQIKQLVGMRGLMANPQGQIIDFPIRSNFREGLTLTEYLISCSGARKGIVDTALRTAASGYLTRRLVDVAHHVIISKIDCQRYNLQDSSTKIPGIVLEDVYDRQNKVLSLHQRLIGRILAENILSPETSLKIGEKNQEISKKMSQQICKSRKKVLVRSPLTCQSSKFICQLCYGWNLAEGKLVSIGEAVGVLAAQAIGEPGTQLTMRTFHTGGVFTGILMDQIYAPFSGTINYSSSCYGILIRTQQGKIAYLSKKEGTLNILPEKKSSSLQLKLCQKLLSNVHKKFDIQFSLVKRPYGIHSNQTPDKIKKSVLKNLNLFQINSFKFKKILRQIDLRFVYNKSKTIFHNLLPQVNWQNLYNNKILLYKLEKLSLKLKAIRSLNPIGLNAIYKKVFNYSSIKQSNIYNPKTPLQVNFVKNISKSYKKNQRVNSKLKQSLSKPILLNNSSHRLNTMRFQPKYYLEFQSSTLLYTRQGEKILQTQLIAEIPNIDQSVENEQEISSSISGEIYFENFIFIEKTFQDLKTITKISENFLQSLGEFWILFGQSFKNFLITKKLTLNFLKKSDWIDELTPFAQISIESTNLLTETQRSKLDKVFFKNEQIQLFFSNFPKKQNDIQQFKQYFQLDKIENMQTSLYLQKYSTKFQISFLFFKTIGYLKIPKMYIPKFTAQTQLDCDSINRSKINLMHGDFWQFRKNTKILLNKKFKTWIIGLQFHSKYVSAYSDNRNPNIKLLIKNFKIQLKKYPNNPLQIFNSMLAAQNKFKKPDSDRLALVTAPLNRLKLKNNFFLSDNLSSYVNSNKFFCEISSSIKQSFVFYRNFKSVKPMDYFFQENLCLFSFNRQGVIRSLGQPLIKNIVDSSKYSLVYQPIKKKKNYLDCLYFNIKTRLVKPRNPRKLCKNYPMFLNRHMLYKFNKARLKISNSHKNFKKTNQPIIIEFKKRYWYSNKNFNLERKSNITAQESFYKSQKGLDFKLLKTSLNVLTNNPRVMVCAFNFKKIRAIFYNFFLKKSLFLQSVPKKWLRQKIGYKAQMLHWQNLSNYKYLFLIFVLQTFTVDQNIKNKNLNNVGLGSGVNTCQIVESECRVNWKNFYAQKENYFSNFKKYYFWRLKKRQKSLNFGRFKIGLYVFIRIFFCIDWNYFKNTKKFDDIRNRFTNLYAFLITHNCSQIKFQKTNSLYLCSIKTIQFNWFFRRLIKKFPKKKIFKPLIDRLHFLNHSKHLNQYFKNVNNTNFIENKDKKVILIPINVLKYLNVSIEKTIECWNKNVYTFKFENNNLFSKFLIDGFLKSFLFCLNPQPIIPVEKKYKVNKKIQKSRFTDAISINSTTKNNFLMKKFYKNLSSNSIEKQTQRLNNKGFSLWLTNGKQKKILKSRNSYIKLENLTSIFDTKCKTNLQNIHWNSQYNGVSLILNTLNKSLNFQKWEFFGDCFLMLEKRQYSTYFKNFIQTDLYEEKLQLTNVKNNPRGIPPKINNNPRSFSTVNRAIHKNSSLFSTNQKTPNTLLNKNETPMFFLDKILPKSIVSAKTPKTQHYRISSFKLQKTILDFYFTSYFLILNNFSFIKNFRKRFFHINPQKPILNVMQSVKNLCDKLIEQQQPSPYDKKLQPILKKVTTNSTLAIQSQLFHIKSFLKINSSSKYSIEYISKKSSLVGYINNSEPIQIKNSYSTRYFKSQIIKQKYYLFQSNPILVSINESLHQVTEMNFTWFLLIFYATQNWPSLNCCKLVFGKKNLDNFFNINGLHLYKSLHYCSSFLTTIKNRKLFRSPFQLITITDLNNKKISLPIENPKQKKISTDVETIKNSYTINSNNFYYSDKVKYLFSPINKNLQFKIFRILKIIILNYLYYYKNKNTFKFYKPSIDFHTQINKIKGIQPNRLKFKLDTNGKSNLFQKPINRFVNKFEIKIPHKTIHLVLLGILPLTQVNKPQPIKIKRYVANNEIPYFLNASYNPSKKINYQNQSNNFYRIYANTPRLNFQFNQTKIVELLSNKYKQLSNLNIKFQIIKKNYLHAVETQIFIRFFLPFLNNEIVDCIDPNINTQTKRPIIFGNENHSTPKFNQFSFQKGLLLINLSDVFAYSRVSLMNKSPKTFKNSKSILMNLWQNKMFEPKLNSRLFLSFSLTKKHLTYCLSKKNLFNITQFNFTFPMQKKHSQKSDKSNLNIIHVCLSQNIFCSINNLYPISYFSKLIKNLKIQDSKPKQSIKFKKSQMQKQLQLGALIRSGDEVSPNQLVLNSGQLIAKTKQKLLFRRASTYLLNKPSILYVKHGELIAKNQRLYSVFYNQSKTGDIIQGIPKIEEIFEARKKSKYRLNELPIFSKDFWFFENQISKYLQNLQKSIVNNIQRIYCGQGVHISDKHIEIIVRQMTSNVLILEPGQTGLLCGEVVALQWIVRMNVPSNPIIYEPLLMGMTKTCLETSSFLSAASFQETTHILGRAALQNQIDFIRGLKPNVILGNLIPIGTGCF